MERRSIRNRRTYKLSGGNDLYITGGLNTDLANNDLVRGGAGADTYDASLANQLLIINLDSIAHDTPFGPHVNSRHQEANRASGENVGTDTIFGFENVNGGANDDVCRSKKRLGVR